jgi:GntR family transcriptional regulator
VNLRIDFRSGMPIYLQIVDQIKQKMLTGELSPNDQLPTVRSLATDLRVNFNTVARAYRILDETGLISTQQGRGTYILAKPDPAASHLLQQRTLQELAEQFVAEALLSGANPDQVMNFVKTELDKNKHE